jgi:hypothetical protein
VHRESQWISQRCFALPRGFLYFHFNTHARQPMSKSRRVAHFVDGPINERAIPRIEPGLLNTARIPPR